MGLCLACFLPVNFINKCVLQNMSLSSAKCPLNGATLTTTTTTAACCSTGALIEMARKRLRRVAKDTPCSMSEAPRMPGTVRKVLAFTASAYLVMSSCSAYLAMSSCSAYLAMSSTCWALPAYSAARRARARAAPLFCFSAPGALFPTRSAVRRLRMARDLHDLAQDADARNRFPGLERATGHGRPTVAGATSPGFSPSCSYRGCSEASPSPYTLTFAGFERGAVLRAPPALAMHPCLHLPSGSRRPLLAASARSGLPAVPGFHLLFCGRLPLRAPRTPPAPLSSSSVPARLFRRLPLLRLAGSTLVSARHNENSSAMR